MLWCKKYVRLLTVVKMKLRQFRDEIPYDDGSDLLLLNHLNEFHTILGNVTTVLLLYCCFIVAKFRFYLDFYNVNKTIILLSELDRCYLYNYCERNKVLLKRLKLHLVSQFASDNGDLPNQLKGSNDENPIKKRCLLNVQMKFKKYLIHCRNNNNDTTRLKVKGCFDVHNKSLRKVFQCSTTLLMVIMMWSLPSVSSSHEQQLNHSPDVIKTKYGLLRGVILKNEPLVEGYLGIPYATPPLGSLRYMPPITPSAWKNIRLVDNYPPVCPQNLPFLDVGMDALFKMPRYRFSQLRNVKSFLSNYSEDCLYLNMFVPKTEIIEKTSSPLATLVYIHGESYDWNSGNFYDGTILAAHSNVIVVTLNFRIGILGFLKTGTKDSTQGNFGLMDLVAALHWLRENLPAFNGNPNMITLMGHGQGAALANILAISPVSNDLIKRVILVSGSALSPWAIQQDPLSLKKKVATDTGCHGDVLEDDLAPCLRQKSLSDLLAIKLDPPRFLPGFAPFTDGFVVPSEIDKNSIANFSELSIPSGGIITELSGIEMANFPKKEFLFGVTSIESYLDFSAQDLEFGFNETKKDRILRTFVRNVFSFHLNEIFSALKNEYTDWERTSRNQIGSRDAALDLVSDGHTVAPLVKIGYLHSLLGGKSYFMHFKHKTEERDYPQRYGSVRGEDVPFFFGLPYSPLFSSKITEGDIQSSEVLMFYLGNFIKTGNPNGNELSENHPTLSIASIDKLKELKKRVLKRPSTSSFQHFQMENYYTINNVSSGLRSEISDKFYNSSKFYNRQSSSSQQQSSGFIGRDTSHPYSLRLRRSSKGSRYNRAYSLHRISRKSLQNSLTGSSIEETFDKSDEEDHGNERNILKKTNSSHEILVPYWKNYETINQMYLEFSLLPKIKHHYRGHKLSMWLSLIPQIQNPEYNSEVSMRHHIFEKDDSIYYDGKIRQQSISKSTIIRAFRTTTSVPVKSTDRSKKHNTISPITECPINTTKSPLIVAVNHVNATAMKTNPFRELISSQYQNYSMAFLLTIFIGCCLLLLNIIIFCAIYYQRVKRKKYVNRKKIMSSDIDDQQCSPDREKRMHMVNQKASNARITAHDESTHCPAHEKQFFCNDKIHQNSNNMIFSKQTPVPKRSVNYDRNNHHHHSESTNSIDKHTSIETWNSPSSRENVRIKTENTDDIPAPPPPPRMRTPAKKRVQIQEISV